jgi:hypothetical protein
MIRPASEANWPGSSGLPLGSVKVWDWMWDFDFEVLITNWKITICSILWCPGAESNHRHRDFQSSSRIWQALLASSENVLVSSCWGDLAFAIVSQMFQNVPRIFMHNYTGFARAGGSSRERPISSPPLVPVCVRAGIVRASGMPRGGRLPSRSARESQAAIVKASCWSPVQPSLAKLRLTGLDKPRRWPSAPPGCPTRRTARNVLCSRAVRG